MSTSDIAISVKDLSKCYLIGHESRQGRYQTFRESIVSGLATLGRKAATMLRGEQIIAGNEVEDFWALKDVSFEVKRGEVLGVIGRNGAGKSTLLKVLSRITEPSQGRVEIHGRVASLLEVGTGFHPELTGRENIFLNGSILGMTKQEVRQKFDEIVAFAEVEKFLDTPVKRYSSGMYVRLAFAVAAFLEPEIMVVDEVLAVGDAEFQKRCIGKMQDVTKGGHTVLFVSHNMSAIRSLCSQGLVLDRGGKIFEGCVDEAVQFYTSRSGLPLGRMQWRNRLEGDDRRVFFESIELQVSGRQRALRLICDCKVRVTSRSPGSFLAIDISDRASTIMQALPTPKPFISGTPGTHRVKLEVELPPLIPGVYRTDFWLGFHNNNTTDTVVDQLAFEVEQGPHEDRSFPYGIEHGSINPITNCLYCGPA